MNKKEIENQKYNYRERQYTYRELMETFLAGSRMASEHHISWREAFEEWIVILEKNRNNALDLS